MPGRKPKVAVTIPGQAKLDVQGKPKVGKPSTAPVAGFGAFPGKVKKTAAAKRLAGKSI